MIKNKIMTGGESSNKNILPNLFRLEYSKMTAVLCRHFGLKHIETAEDIASDTFLKASETWAIDGIPKKPTAWLYKVAKNKTKDYLRHITIAETKIKKEFNKDDLVQSEKNIEFSTQNITDSQLAMIFAVCNPVNSQEAQISLALQILCGFSIEEISNAFLSKKETIKKRLLRARTNLRNDNFQIHTLTKETIQSRLDTVLRTLYLLFNEGYYSKSDNQLIRKNLCSEAMRLLLILVENPLTNEPQCHALLSLMCFQSSRLDARVNTDGETISFEKQDKNLWSKELIDKGNYYLVNACSGNHVSKYHLEAGIAYWHTTSDGPKKWEHILQLYNQLIIIEYSPVTSLNRAFAYAKVYGNESAIKEVEKLELIDNTYYHSLLGYLHSQIDVDKAIEHYNRAIDFSKSPSEKKVFEKEIEKLKVN